MSISFLRRTTPRRHHLPPFFTHSPPSQNEEDKNRCYHATHQKPILPLLAVGTLGIISVYSYRALKQMDEDWEEYYDRLEEYRAATGETGEENSSRSEISSMFTGGTLAIDLGSSKLKLAHLGQTSKKPSVMVGREGARSTPSLVWMSSNDDDDVLVGRMAEGRIYDNKGGHILHPWEALMDNQADNKANQKAIQKSIRMAASNALEQVLGGNKSQQSAPSSSLPLFVLDASMAYSGAYNTRPVFTYPFTNEAFLPNYKNALQDITSPEGIELYVPEPVAIVAGARYYSLLPANAGANDAVIVVDVGGSTTSVSIVSNQEEVVYSSSIPLGGDTFVDLLTTHLIHGFYGNSTDNKENHEADDSNIPSTKPTLNDPTALQRIYEASTTAMHELSNKSRSEINIPYLSIDLQSKQPKHLEVGVARNIIDTRVENFIRDRLVPYLQNSSDVALSQSLPQPRDMSTLFSSTLASAMEHTSLTPQSLCAVLLVGGGARIPLVREAMKRGVGQVGGDFFLDRLVVPEGEMGEELAVLGAALWGGSGR